MYYIPSCFALQVRYYSNEKALCCPYFYFHHVAVDAVLVVRGKNHINKNYLRKT